MSSDARILPLDKLRQGRSGRIVGIEGEGQSVARLHALGFLPGRVVRHRNTAPLGDPAAYELDGQKVSLRDREAALVRVREEHA